MMKKEYLKPELEIVDVKIETLMAQTSMGFESSDDNGGDAEDEFDFVNPGDRFDD